MNRWPFFAVAFVVVFGCLWAARAFADAGDKAATSAYLYADREANEEVNARVREDKLAMYAFVDRTIAECPDVAGRAPHGPLLDKFKQEAFTAVGIAGEQPFQTAADKLASRIEPLHWSSEPLDTLVHSYAAKLRETSTAPPLCVELKEWVASGYGPLPSRTTRFLEVEVTRSSKPEEAIMARLVRYTDGHMKHLWQAVRCLERRDSLAVDEVGFPAVARLEEGLGLLRPRRATLKPSTGIAHPVIVCPR
jgi:hypothetical protein